MGDFEDAAVATVAEASGSTFVVTRYIADFAQSSEPGIAPANLLILHALAA